MLELEKNVSTVIQLLLLIFFTHISHNFLSFWFYNSFFYLNKSKTTASLHKFFFFNYSWAAKIIKLLLECDLIISVLVKWSNYCVYLSFDLNSCLNLTILSLDFTHALKANFGYARGQSFFSLTHGRNTLLGNVFWEGVFCL